MRKLAITIVVIVALLVVAALVAPRFINVNRYHDKIQSELEQRMGRQVSLGEMHLSILPLAFRVDNAVIGEDPSFGTKPFAQTKELDVSAKLWPLVHGDVQVNSLELKQPQIEIIRNPEGVWNFSSIGKPGTSGHATPPPETAGQRPSATTGGKPSPATVKPEGGQQPPSSASSSSGNQKSLSIADLKITDGQVALTDMQKHQPRSVYDHIDLRLMNYAQDQPFDIQAAAHLPGAGNQEIKLDGHGGPINQADPASTPFKGTLELAQVSIGGLQKFLNSQSLSGTDGMVSGKTDFNNQAGKIASSGSLKIDQPRVRGHEVGYPIAADYSFSDDLNAGALHIDKGLLKLGATPLSISGDINTKATPMELNLKVNANNVSLQEAAKLAASLGVAFNPGMDFAGRLNADVHAQGPANQPALNGTLSANDLVISGKDLKEPVNVKAIELALTPEEIRSNDFTASTGGTAITGRFSLSRYTSASPAVDATLKTVNANLGELLNVAKAYGVSAAEGMTGSGMVSLDVHASGPLKNSAAMIFSGTGAVQNAELKSATVSQPLKIKNADLRFSQNSAMLDNLTASLGSTNATGSMTARNFAAPDIQFTLAADQINVAELQKILGVSQVKRASLSGFWNFVSTAQAAATASPSATSQGMLDKITGGGNLSVGSITYQDLVLNNVRSKVALDHGVIRMNPVTAQLYNGQETGAITVDARKDPIVFDVQSKLDKVDANKMLSSVSSLKQTLYGMLAANANTSFNTGGNGNIASTLNGNLGLNLANGKLAKIDLLYELANIGKFLSTGKQISQKGFTNLTALTGNFNVRNGVAQTNDLKAVIDGGTLAGNGLINLADETLNMHLTAVLTQAMTKSVGGVGNIGGYMNTALANKNGELVVPVIVTGTFSNPHFAPDVEKIAQMKLNNLLPTSANPGNLTSGIMGAILGNKNGNNGPASGQGQGQNSGLQGILNSLPGRKQPAQPTAPSGNQQGQAAPQQNPAGPSQTQQQQQQQASSWQDVLGQALGKKKQQPASTPPANGQPQPASTPPANGQPQPQNPPPQ
jgi:uncharacterized protein involved in outer membrane biogenesis